MELEESQIINIAVNIFQNVGIKRYIGSIEALMHEDIYFQIYKIIFPDSMINIFKISDSSLTTGEKIQRIINEISSIIGLDLYHIQGEAIAQGNMNHLINWLQLLQALSSRCVPAPVYPRGGSAPDLDQQKDIDFPEDDYYTVLGIPKQFDNHGYSEDDDDTTNRQQEEQQDHSEQNYNIQKDKNIKNLNNYHGGIKQKPDPNNDDYNYNDKQSSHHSNLKPVDQVVNPQIKTKSKYRNNKQKQKKKVTFKFQTSPKMVKTHGSSIAKNGTNHINNNNNNRNYMKKIKETNTSASTNCQNNLNTGGTTRKIPMKNIYGCGNAKGSKKLGDKLLFKKLGYINTMHEAVEQVQRSKIVNQNIEFKDWVYCSNQSALRQHMKIEQQNQLRTQLINMKINERDEIVDSLAGEQGAMREIRNIMKGRKRLEKNIKRHQMREMIQQAEMLMDDNFADGLQEMIMTSMNE